MRVLIISEGLGKNYYGVSQVILKLNEQVLRDGASCRILVANVGDISNLHVEVKKIPVGILENSFRWHPGLHRFFIDEMTEFKPDVVHVHGVFTAIQRAAVQAARAMHLPILLSLHGMLEDWTWHQKGQAYFWRKRLFWQVLLRPMLRAVDYVHVITQLESKTADHEFPGIPQLMISNAIDLSQVPDVSCTRPKKEFVFLGRLHPKKGIHLLISAFSQASLCDEWRLSIIGPGDNLGYVRQLHQLAENLQANNRVQFVGPVYGNDKYELLASAWAAVFPSYSDVVALVNLEAAAVSTPSITTYATGLQDWEQGGGILVDAKEEHLAQALSRAASWSMDDRLKNGEKMRRLVRERYSWDVIGKTWLEAYRKVGLTK